MEMNQDSQNDIKPRYESFTPIENESGFNIMQGEQLRQRRTIIANSLSSSDTEPIEHTQTQNIQFSNGFQQSLYGYLSNGFSEAQRHLEQVDDKKYKKKNIFGTMFSKVINFVKSMLYTAVVVFYQLLGFFYLHKKRFKDFNLLGVERDTDKSAESGITVVRENRIRKWIRKTWKNRRRHYKRIILAILSAIAVIFLCMYCYKYVLVAISTRGSIGEMTIDDLDRPIENVISPLLLNKDSPVDESLILYILSPSMSGVFKSISDENIRSGFAETDIPTVTLSFDYKVEKANVSLIDLYDKMLAYTLEKSKNSEKSVAEIACVCSAHYGIPLNIIMTGDSRKISNPTSMEEAEQMHSIWFNKLMQISTGTISARTKIAKMVETLVQYDDILFMINPGVTSKSSDTLKAYLSDSLTLKGKKTEVKCPRSVWVAYKDITGNQQKTRLSGAQAMCTTRCLNIALKYDITDRHNPEESSFNYNEIHREFPSLAGVRT